jgi:class 3 adenylate cyclase
MGGEDQEPTQRTKKTAGKIARAARKVDSSPALLTAAKLLREMLPGDSQFGDPLSTGGREGSQQLGKRLAELTEKRPGLVREAGLSALQVWEAVSESQGRGRGKRDLAIVFTDLVEFSAWAVEAGDDAVLDLLRDVGRATEPPVTDHGGEVVKRLGDGMMAVFDDVGEALAAVQEACKRLGEVKADGYEPRLRAGIHFGRPRKLGGDYLGVDVNVAARLAQEAGGDEILISGEVKDRLGDISAKKKRRFSVKGVPKDLQAWSVRAQ